MMAISTLRFDQPRPLLARLMTWAIKGIVDMKRLFCPFLFLLPWVLSAQMGIDSLQFRDSSNYSMAVEHYLGEIDKGHTGFKNYYQVAGYSALSGRYDIAFRYLKEAIQRGARGEDVLTDTDFNGLRQDVNHWREIEALLKIQYSERYPGISNPDLGYELWLMWIEDQRYRTLRKNYKLNVPPSIDTEIHIRNLARVIEIVNSSGWPKYSEVGITAGDAVFFLYQHDSASNMKKVLPALISAAKANEADIAKAAMMIDRYLAYTEHVQLYGTQAFRKIEQGQDRTVIPLSLYPITDEANLFKRRASLGMGDFLENCERLGVEYIPIQNRTSYKAVAIRKRWIRAGYLL
jgi:hypothetical protein